MKSLAAFALLLAQLVVIAQAAVCTASTHVGRVWYNACSQRCVCTEVTGPEYVWRCYRERKEFTCMSATERQRFIDTFKTVSTPGHTLYPQYQSLLARHATGFGTIHSTANFLPWHRWFAKEMEDLLQHVDCRVTLPWWDWSKKSATPFVGSPFLDSPDWLGTNGVSGCVQDGPFDTSIWNPPNVACLNRQFSGTMPTSVQIASVLSTSSGAYSTFSDTLETQIHNGPHVRIGGTMVTGNSPDAPEFFMHHGFIDKLWDDWQKKSNAHLNAYSFSSASAMPYAMGATPGDVNDLKDSGIMYVRYSNPTSTGLISAFPRCLLIKLPVLPHVFDLSKIQEQITLADPKLLARVPQLPFTALNPEESKRMLEMAWESGADEKHIQQMDRKLKVAQEQVRRANEGRNIVLKFDDEYSQQVGYDLPSIIELLEINPSCMPGEAWSESEQECIPVSCEFPSACGPEEECVPIDVVCDSPPCPQFKCVREVDSGTKEIFLTIADTRPLFESVAKNAISHPKLNKIRRG